MANFDTIDELKIKISVDESGDVAKSLNEIIDKLDKIDKAGGGKADKFASLLTTLENMDKSLSKISHSLTRVSLGIATIAASAKQWGSQFSNSLDRIDNGMGNIAETTKKSAESFSDITKGATEAATALSNVKIETYFDDSSIMTVTESIDETRAVLNSATEGASEFKAVLEETSTVEAPFKQYDTQKIIAEMDAYVGSLKRAVSEEERFSAIDLSRQYTQIDLLIEKRNELADKLALMLREDNFGGKAFANVIAELQKTEAQIERIRQSEAEAAHEAERLRFAFLSFSAIGSRLKSAVHSPLANIARTMLKIQTFPITAIGREISSIGKRLKGVLKSFIRVAKMRAFRYIIRQITQGIREGIDNAYQWAKVMGNEFAGSLDRISTTSLYLKNSLGAMAMPLINAVTPALEYVIDKFVDLLNVANRVFALLRGQTTWTKAIKYPKEFAEGMNNAAGAAEKLNDELITILGIDEINPMNAAKDSSGGSGGGASEILDYASMFEEVAMTSENIFGKMFDPLKNAWENKGQGVLSSIERMFSSIKQLGSSLTASFKIVWQNGTGQHTIETILQIFTNIFDTISNITLAFDRGWNTNNLGTDILQNIWDIGNGILETYERITGVTAEWAKGIDFTPLLGGIENVTGAFKRLLEPIENSLVYAWENVLLPFGRWVIQDLAPVALDLIAEALSTIAEVWKLAGPVFEWLWNNILSPTLGAVGGWVIDALEGVRDFLKEIKEFLQDINDLINGNKTLQEFLETRSFKPTETQYSQREDWQTPGQTPTVREDSWTTTHNLLFDKTDRFEIPVDLKGENLIDEVPKKQKTIADILAEANALGKVAGFKNYIDTFDTKATSLGAASGYRNELRTFPVQATRLDKATGYKNNVYQFGTQATSLGKAPGYKNNVYQFGTLATSLGKATGFTISDALKQFPTYAKSLSAAAGFTISDGVKKIYAYAKSLSQASGFSVSDGVKNIWAYAKGLWYTNDYEKNISKKVSDIWAYAVGLWYTKDYEKNISSKVSDIWAYALGLWPSDSFSINDGVRYFVAYATELKKSEKFKGFDGKIAVSSGAGGSLTYQFKKRGGIFSNGSWKNIPQYAGGSLNAGSLFFAGEAGAEIVGNVNGRTEVLNRSQIASAMEASVISGNAQQNRLLQEQNQLLRELINKQGNARAYVTSGDIIDGLQQRNRRDGRTVVAIGV